MHKTLMFEIALCKSTRKLRVLMFMQKGQGCELYNINERDGRVIKSQEVSKKKLPGVILFLF